MMKHSIALLVAVATSALSGCQLYFGEDHDNESWTYCGQDGYYECTDQDCYWVGSECPAGTSTTPPGGFDCQTDADCAAGCYCGNGVCEEAGFCAQDSDCGAGFQCDEQRSSCEPIGGDKCGTDADCGVGQFCDTATGTCTGSCVCNSDAEATAQGFDYCDESRTTCQVGVDPAGDCTGAVTCNLGRPTCPEGQVALISEGCYTGECAAINSCSQTPGCSAYGYASDCTAAGTCTLSYTGINCRTPDNTPCQAGSTSCTCQSYQFASCSDAASPRIIVQYNGYEFDASELTLK